MYSPQTGRFNRLDPFAGDRTKPLSFNKYLYTHANPVNSKDPTGLFSLIETLTTQFNNAKNNIKDWQAAFHSLKTAKDVNDVVRGVNIFYRAISGVAQTSIAAYDTVSSLRTIFDLKSLLNRKEFKESFDKIKQTFSQPRKIFENVGRLGLVEFVFDMPKGFKKLLNALTRRLGGLSNPLLSELGAEATAALIAKGIGFETTEFRVGYRGIDGLLYDPIMETFVILEAKGGSSRLNKTTGQMKEKWITKKLKSLERRNRSHMQRNFPDQYDDLRDNIDKRNRTRKKMWAMVVSADYRKHGRKKEIVVQFQHYRTGEKMKPWKKRYSL